MPESYLDAWDCAGLSPLDPASVRSRFENEIGGKFLPLVSACLDWKRENSMHLLHTKTLQAALQTDDFKAICSIHKDLKSNGKEHCVPRFLLELVDGGYGPGFMIAYAFLVRSVPKEYNLLSVSLLGYASQLVKILDEISC